MDKNNYAIAKYIRTYGWIILIDFFSFISMLKSQAVHHYPTKNDFVFDIHSYFMLLEVLRSLFWMRSEIRKWGAGRIFFLVLFQFSVTGDDA